MDAIEWRQVRDAIKAAWPGVAKWFGTNPQAEATGGLWKSTLDRYGVDEIKEAIGDLFAEREELPRSYERYPAAIAAVCRKHRRDRSAGRPMRVDGQDAYRCLLCHDDGRVVVWHPQTLRDVWKAVRAGTTATCFLNTAATRCTCDAGLQYAYLPEYSPAKWCAWELGVGREDAIRHIETWLTHGRAEAADNFDSSLAEFS